MKMVNNPVIYEALAEQYLRSILDISAAPCFALALLADVLVLKNREAVNSLER